MDSVTQMLVDTWHRNNGGHAEHPRSLGGHALRMLNEAVELCFACGVTPDEIDQIVDRSIRKEIDREGENDMAGEDEIADVAICLAILANYMGLDIRTCANDKLDVLLGRKWEADEYGVLWRPGRSFENL